MASSNMASPTPDEKQETLGEKQETLGKKQEYLAATRGPIPLGSWSENTC